MVGTYIECICEKIRKQYNIIAGESVLYWSLGGLMLHSRKEELQWNIRESVKMIMTVLMCMIVKISTHRIGHSEVSQTTRMI